jgi:hypothetical protein
MTTFWLHLWQVSTKEVAKMTGEDMRRARSALGWTPERLAHAAGGADAAAVSRIEGGLVERITEALRGALRARVGDSLQAGRQDTRASEALAALQGAEASHAR